MKEKLIELLKEYKKTDVDVFINYLVKLKNEKKDGKPVNYWFGEISTDDFATAFIKVASNGLTIDGDTITLNYLKKLVITYDYHAYMNKIMISYPETQFDFGIVYDGDEFDFKKESGKVIYSHKKNNPFETNKKIIGAYGIIKNSKGEFLETINNEDIDKMRKSSRMQFIWNTWLDRMVLKSVIKRICSIHFKDLVKDIETQDNELNDPNRASLEAELLLTIDEADTVEQIDKIYASNIAKIKDKKQFIQILADKKKGLNND